MTQLCTMGGVTMYQGERPNRSKPPGAFRRYVLDEHERWANEREGPGNVFRGVALHARNNEEMAAWNVPNPSTHFSHAFTKFLENGIKDQRREKDREAADYRWARVEAAILWLDEQDPHLAEILRYFQQPTYVRPVALAKMAGKYGLTVDGLESRCTQAVRRLWWRLGFSF